MSSTPPGDTPPPGWQPGSYGSSGQQPPPPNYVQQPGGGQQPYGQPLYGQQPPYDRYPPYGQHPPPRSRGPIIWLVSGGVVLLAAIVAIVLILSGGTSTTPAASHAASDRPTHPSSHPSSAGHVGSSSSSVHATGGRSPVPTATSGTPTSISGASSCSSGTQPDLVAVSVTTVLGLTPKGTEPNSYVASVLKDCTSSAVHRKISALYGVPFTFEVGSDLTGHDGTARVAKYRVPVKKSHSYLDVTLTRQSDGRYLVTAYAYHS